MRKPSASGTALAFGLKFSTLPYDGVLAWLNCRRQSDKFEYIITPNVDHIVRLSRMPELRPLYDHATLLLCDGRVVRNLAAIADVKLNLVSGSDLTRSMFVNIVASNDEVCVVGGDTMLLRRLQALRPDVTFHQMIPPMGLRTDADARSKVVAYCLAQKARYIFLAVGSPQQEMIAGEIATQPEAIGTALCIGGALDYLVNIKHRAPIVVQRLGFEFLWRIAEDPARLWRRYLLDGPVIFKLFVHWLRDRRARRL